MDGEGTGLPLLSRGVPGNAIVFKPGLLRIVAMLASAISKMNPMCSTTLAGQFIGV